MARSGGCRAAVGRGGPGACGSLGDTQHNTNDIFHWSWHCHEGVEYGDVHMKGRRSRNVTVHQRKIHEDEDIGSSPLFGPIPLTGPPPSYSGFIEHRKIAASLYSPCSSACTSCPQDLLMLFRAPSGRCICRRGISGIGGHSAGNCRRCLARCHKCWSPRHLSQCHWVCDLLVAVQNPTM